MSEDIESRIQALEWLIGQVAADGLLHRDNSLAAAQTLIDDSNQLTGDLIQMANEQNADADMHLAILDTAAARDALVEHIYKLVEAGLREREARV